MKLQTEESRYKPTKRGTSWYKLYRTTQTDLSQQKRIRNISNASEKNRVFYNYKLWRISEADEGKLGQLMFYWAADRHIVCRSRRQYTLTEAATCSTSSASAQCKPAPKGHIFQSQKQCITPALNPTQCSVQCQYPSTPRRWQYTRTLPPLS